MPKANYGDLIFVDHGLYKHFGIYINDDCVIHYDGKIDDRFLREMCIRQTTLDRFLASKDSFSIYNFNCSDIDACEVVSRAKSRIGEENFNLIFNNCEHFGLWCKTGVSKSNQVNLIVNLILFTIFFDFILNKKC
ncbi:lecithin retinol acyltransferase family protein [Paraclostridium bifermentans]|uniref:lecithin retinol acyltransferase family protein n=1 Tax=Paraclostridium bifermentans TaxID=1490 RepID=UPI00359CA5DD